MSILFTIGYTVVCARRYLLGAIKQFLMLRGPDSDDNKVESMEHCEKFWYWLQDKGISAHRSAIVKAIALKVNGLLPGVYDADLYDDEDDDEE
mmetsp:Transcript_10907/g.23689  ORF Transcript_10907/g.23689 Transcript_10907/m.23689 type:complete len:93 (-) Transcript_10907:109-387(-)